MVSYCQHENEPSGSITFLTTLCSCWLLKDSNSVQLVIVIRGYFFRLPVIVLLHN
jgi:hypothetical protein